MEDCVRSRARSLVEMLEVVELEDLVGSSDMDLVNKYGGSQGSTLAGCLVGEMVRLR